MPKIPSAQRKQMAKSTQYRLIGQFIWHWNLFERILNDAIVKICKLEELCGLVITANLSFQPKMNVLTTMIDLLGSRKSEQWKEEVKNTIARIHTINNEWRILVAHNLAVIEDMKSIRFLRHSAKRKLQFPRIVKTKKEFEDISNEIFLLGQRIERYCVELSHQPNQPSALARALAISTTPQPAGLGFAGLLHLPHQGVSIHPFRLPLSEQRPKCSEVSWGQANLTRRASYITVTHVSPFFGEMHSHADSRLT